MASPFVPARRRATNVLAGLGGTSGSGKTRSALLLASGMGGKIAVIDSERGRALHYAEDFKFDHAEIEPPYTPARYVAMMEQAGKHVGAGGVVIVDSMSHEWAGEGGIRDSATQRQKDFAAKWGGSPDKYGLLAWSDPKQQHQALVEYLLKVDFHVILCFRGREKVKFVDTVDDKGKSVQKVMNVGIKPISEKDFAFEMTFFAVMSPETPGVPLWTHKALMKGLHPVFRDGKQIDVDTGKRLAAWAAGTKAVKKETEEVSIWVDREGKQVGEPHERIRSALDAFEKAWNADKDRMSHHRNLALLTAYQKKAPSGEIKKVIGDWIADMNAILQADYKQ